MFLSLFKQIFGLGSVGLVWFGLRRSREQKGGGEKFSKGDRKEKMVGGRWLRKGGVLVWGSVSSKALIEH